MNFVEFVNITRPIIGGKDGIHIYVRTLFDAILTENGKEILDSYSIESYKAYAGGKTSINGISKAMVQYIDPVEFSSFIFNTEESAQIALYEQFTEFLPNININNVGDEIAELFANAEKIETEGSQRTVATLKTINRNVSDGKRYPVLEKVLKNRLLFANLEKHVA